MADTLINFFFFYKRKDKLLEKRTNILKRRGNKYIEMERDEKICFIITTLVWKWKKKVDSAWAKAKHVIDMNHNILVFSKLRRKPFTSKLVIRVVSFSFSAPLLNQYLVINTYLLHKFINNHLSLNNNANELETPNNI